MRYLQNRENFLNKKVELDRSKVSDYYKSSKMIREVGENDITWGGSLIGRLINSAIRKFKIGVKQVQIPPLLDELKNELDYLVSASMKGKAKETLDLLKLKRFMEQIKDQCLRPSKTEDEEEEIIKELLGAGYNSGNAVSKLYNPKNPKEKVETEGLVQEVINTLNDDFPDLKEILGIGRETILDTLSDFNDELRKYYFTILKPGEDTGGETLDSTSSIKRFQQNFGNIIQVLNQKKTETTLTT